MCPCALNRHADYPVAPLFRIDTLWFQMGGTRCNLQCRHCLVSASPTSATHQMMTLDEIRLVLQQTKDFEVKEFYFTGGEPFLNPAWPAIIGEALKYGPTTVLTNGTLITTAKAKTIREISLGGQHPLDIRISLDGMTEEFNDQIRGKGSFKHILQGIRNLVNVDINPVITFTKAMKEWEGVESYLDTINGFLRSIGINQPRVKILGLFHMGEEENRTRPYQADETLKGFTLSDCELLKLQCTTSRTITHEGAYVCPILVNEPMGYLGKSFYNTFRPFKLAHPACYTCYKEGVTCRT